MTYTMDKYKEILKQIKKDFLKEYDWDYYKIGLYHGTDRFVLDLSDEKRKIYKEALIEYLDTICKMN
ncbi:MAG: hypothetical protein IK078_10205, partial [Lachnospiraceae bacterium]|nr:hypothetical protein [Lachnospiraceae bacterium]